MRVVALAIGTVAAVLVARTAFTSWDWVGRVFPGFVVLTNSTIASSMLPHWSGRTEKGLFQSRILRVDGRVPSESSQIYDWVDTCRPEGGQVVRYELDNGSERFVRAIACQRFELRDWTLLFGFFLLNGIVFLASGLVVWILRPTAPVARAFLIFGAAMGCFLFTAMDLYGPGTLTRLYLAADAFLPAAGLHLALFFPSEHRRANLRFAGYALAAVMCALYQLFFADADVFRWLLRVNMSVLGMVAVFWGTRLVSDYRRAGSLVEKRKIRTVLVGIAAGISGPGIALVLSSGPLAQSVPMTVATMTPFIFALSIAYGIAGHDLFEVPATLKRGAVYLLLTGSIVAIYMLGLALFGFLLSASEGGREFRSSGAFAVVFALAVVLFFDPLRRGLQRLVDRLFYGPEQDRARILAQAGAALATALRREEIAGILRQHVAIALPNDSTALFLETRDGDLGEVGGDRILDPSLLASLTAGRIVADFDAPEAYPDPAESVRVRAGLKRVGATLAVPILMRGTLAGALLLGPRRSAALYTAADAAFLRALTSQAAIALQNAASYEELVALNANLEERVSERTAQLESVNQDLQRAYAELQDTEVQLVQSEKMASLGRLVAGVAHEINNPVSFIASSVVPLRRRLAEARSLAQPETSKPLAEAEELVGIIERGAERTAGIVKDLRSFSRLGESDLKPCDLNDSLETTIRLVESRFADRITIHRDFAELPAFECDAGQLNQVFMNLLVNACEAIPASGNVWVSTASSAEGITISVRDEGVGIDPEILGRVFDPFFTTKDVGAGTGLGLAVSHGVVSAHGGVMQVESEPGRGTTFRVVLPQRSRQAAASRAS